MKKILSIAFVVLAFGCTKQPEPFSTPTKKGEIEWRAVETSNSTIASVLTSNTFNDWLRDKGYSGFSAQARYAVSGGTTIYTVPVTDQSDRDNIEITLSLYSSENAGIVLPIVFEHVINGSSHSMTARGLLTNQVIKQFSWTADGVEPGGFTDDPQWQTPCPEQDYSFEDCFQCGCWDMQQDVVGLIAFSVAPIECMVGIALGCAIGIIAPNADSMTLEEKINWANDQINNNILSAFQITTDSKLIIN